MEKTPFPRRRFFRPVSLGTNSKEGDRSEDRSPSGKILATSYSPGAYAQVPSALKSLTSVFGMGTGGSFPLSSPEISGSLCPCSLKTA